MKIVALTYEASFMSNPSAFSLNLSTDVVTSANSSGNFVAYIHDRLSRHLKPIYTTLGLDCEFFFWVEVTSDDINTAHLHGVIGLPPGARSGLALYSKVRKAMKKAGGEGWTPHATERQVDLRSLWGPQGWGGYIAKRRRFTSWVIKDHRLMSATKKLRTRAGERYDSARRSGEILTGFVRH